MSGPTYVRVPENDAPDYPMPLGFQPDSQRNSPSVPGGTFIPLTPIHSHGAQPNTAPGAPVYHPYAPNPAYAHFAQEQAYALPNYGPPTRADYPPRPSQSFPVVGNIPHGTAPVPLSSDFVPSTPHLTGEAFEREMATKTYTFSATQLLNDAWSAYKANWGLLTSFTCLTLGTVAVVFVAIVILVVSHSQLNQEEGYYQNGSNLTNKSVLLKLSSFSGLYGQDEQDKEPSENTPAEMSGFILILIVFELIVYSIMPSLFAGYYTVLFHHIRGTEVRFSHFFQGFRAFLPLLGLQVICSLANNIHFLVGIYIAMALSFSPMLFLEHSELGFFKSLTLSFRVVHRNITDNLFLVGLSLVLLIVGSFVFFISLPVMYFMYGFAYLYVFGLSGVTVVQSVV